MAQGGSSKSIQLGRSGSRDFLGLLGQTIAGKYKLEEAIGRGGSGVVYRGLHLGLGKPVAIKVLYPSLASSDLLKRFFREAKAAASLRHPAVVDVIDLGRTEDGVAYLVMEMLEGRSFTELIFDGPLPADQASYLVLDALDGLAAAHESGIIHRDIKPGNLLLAKQGQTVQVKLVDFGTAKLTSSAEATLTKTGIMIGTPGFLSPEQQHDFKRVGFRSDLYSMGAVLFYTLVGEGPLGRGPPEKLLARLVRGKARKHPAEHQTGVPQWLDALIARALDEDPDKRPADAREFIKLLETGIEEEGWDPHEARRQLRARLEEEEIVLEGEDLSPEETATERLEKPMFPPSPQIVLSRDSPIRGTSNLGSEAPTLVIPPLEAQHMTSASLSSLSEAPTLVIPPLEESSRTPDATPRSHRQESPQPERESASSSNAADATPAYPLWFRTWMLLLAILALAALALLLL